MPRDGSATRQLILETAERLVIDRGFSATSVRDVIAATGTSKGAFFHHFSSKADLARQLVERYASADIGHLMTALEATAAIDDPGDRLLAFLQRFTDEADELMSTQSSCLYVALLTERQLEGNATRAPIMRAVVEWRRGIAAMLAAALADRRPDITVDCDAWADHVFVTFEGAFILCRSTGDPSQMRRQLQTLRDGFAALIHAER